MLYIRKLHIVDDVDRTVIKIEHKEATKGLQKALQILERYEGKSGIKKTMGEYLKELDKELQEYFKI